MVKVFFLILTIFCCNNCIKTVHVSGQTLEQEQIEALHNAKSKADVERLIGSPTSVSSFGQETWYYISSTKESVAFLKDKILKQDIFAISFNPNGSTNIVTRYNEQDANKPVIVSEYTVTKGTSTSPVQHFLSNVGKYRDSKPAKPETPHTGF